MYDNKAIIVKNSWNPIVHKEYKISNITKIEISSEAFVGGALKISFNNGTFKKVITDISSTKLKKMIVDIESIIGKENDE
jgi:hypothetical protein